MTEPVSPLGKIIDCGIRLKLNPKDWIHRQIICDIIEIAHPLKWHDQPHLMNLANKIQSSDRPLLSFYSDLLLGIDDMNSSDPNIVKFCWSVHQKLIDLGHTVPEHFHEIEICIEELEEFYKCWTVFKKKGLGSSLDSFQSALSLGELVQETTKDESLMLSTVNTMKGLEKDIIVFMMAMCEGIFPDYRAKSDVEIAEERNNAFVAVTRAMRWLYVSYPVRKRMPWGKERTMKKSQFIQEIYGNDRSLRPISLNLKKEFEYA